MGIFTTFSPLPLSLSHSPNCGCSVRFFGCCSAPSSISKSMNRWYDLYFRAISWIHVCRTNFWWIFERNLQRPHVLAHSPSFLIFYDNDNRVEQNRARASKREQTLQEFWWLQAAFESFFPSARTLLSFTMGRNCVRVYIPFFAIEWLRQQAWDINSIR